MSVFLYVSGAPAWPILRFAYQIISVSRQRRLQPAMALRWSIRRKVRLSGGLGFAAADKIKEDKMPYVAVTAQSLHAVSGVEIMNEWRWMRIANIHRRVLEWMYFSILTFLIICKYSNCLQIAEFGLHLNVLFLVTEHMKYFLSNVCSCVYHRSQWLSWLPLQPPFFFFFDQKQMRAGQLQQLQPCGLWCLALFLREKQKVELR